MPQVIKTQLADKDFNVNTYKAFFKLADEVFAANKLGASAAPAVVAATTASSAADLDATLPALQYPVNATNFRGRGGRGRGNRGNRGGRGRGAGLAPAQSAPTPSSNTKSPATTTTKEQDLPANLCSMHKKYQKNAMHCRDPFVCEWAQFIIPRPTK